MKTKWGMQEGEEPKDGDVVGKGWGKGGGGGQGCGEEAYGEQSIEWARGREGGK